MGRSRSRSGCRRVPVSVYCGKKKHRSRRRRRRGGSSKRRKRSRSRKRSKSRRCGSRRRKASRKRSRSRRKSRRSKCRPGIKTRNPFLNYLRVFRKKHCGWPQCKIAIEGAKCWCKMNNQEREKFYKEACSMRKSKGKKGRKGKRRRRRSRRRRGNRKAKKKCPS